MALRVAPDPDNILNESKMGQTAEVACFGFFQVICQKQPVQGSGSGAYQLSG